MSPDQTEHLSLKAGSAGVGGQPGVQRPSKTAPASNSLSIAIEHHLDSNPPRAVRLMPSHARFSCHCGMMRIVLGSQLYDTLFMNVQESWGQIMSLSVSDALSNRSLLYPKFFTSDILLVFPRGWAGPLSGHAILDYVLSSRES